MDPNGKLKLPLINTERKKCSLEKEFLITFYCRTGIEQWREANLLGIFIPVGAACGTKSFQPHLRS
jgi:hypothetical protein